MGNLNAQNLWYKFSNQPIEDIKMFKDDNSVREIIGRVSTEDILQIFVNLVDQPIQDELLTIPPIQEDKVLIWYDD